MRPTLGNAVKHAVAYGWVAPIEERRSFTGDDEKTHGMLTTAPTNRAVPCTSYPTLPYHGVVRIHSETGQG